MQLPLFYEEQSGTDTGEFVLSPDNSRYIAQVLRMNPGEQLLLTDGKGYETKVEITIADKRNSVVTLIDRRQHPAPEATTAIGISLLKNENRFEWFLEKATELGINRIVPLICERTEKKSFRMERMRNITVSAMIQSQQYYLPDLPEPVALKELLKTENYPLKMIAHCLPDENKAGLSAINRKDASRIILIGPEGDFSPKEIEDCLKAGYKPVSLGENRLRTETAGVTAAVLLVN
ncbi:MAG: 16S rRNA (uracil(1498)-N(3))-methyltransferase [Chitinophagaceae bacterium]|nr:16S rRNA (uracil(1498)-N(3))-methyltransferase [Chitinophagaceae bacterium]